MASPIDEYLVRLGFAVDTAGHKKFDETLSRITSGMSNLSEQAVAVASAIGLAVEKTAAQGESLFYLAQRTGSSAQSLQSMAFAFTQIGLSAGDAHAAIDGFAMSLRLNPSLIELLHRLGVKTEGRSPTQEYHDLVGQLRKVDFSIAAPIAGMFGTSPLQLLQQEQNFDKEGEAADKYEKMLKNAGINTGDWTTKSQEFMTSLREMEAQFDILGIKIGLDFIKPAKAAVDEVKELTANFLAWDDSVGGVGTKIGTVVAALGGLAALKGTLSWLFGRGAGAAPTTAPAIAEVGFLGWLRGLALGAGGLGGASALSLIMGDASGNAGMAGYQERLRKRIAAGEFGPNPYASSGTGGLGALSTPEDLAGASGGSWADTRTQRIAYIRMRAAALGVDPDTAVRVAGSEGLNRFSGDNGSSFGDFQLHVGGGLGDAFMRATGLDPSDAKNWQGADDFALQSAARGGWGPFHGAARVGIAPWDGITPSGADGARGGDISVAPHTTINVTGSDPRTTADHVLAGQAGINADVIRNAGANFR